MGYGIRRTIPAGPNQIHVYINETVQVVVTRQGAGYTVSMPAGKDITQQLSTRAKAQIERAIASNASNAKTQP